MLADFRVARLYKLFRKGVNECKVFEAEEVSSGSLGRAEVIMSTLDSKANGVDMG